MLQLIHRQDLQTLPVFLPRGEFIWVLERDVVRRNLERLLLLLLDLMGLSDFG